MRRRFEARRNLKLFAVSHLVVFYLVSTPGSGEPCWSGGGGGGAHGGHSGPGSFPRGR